MVLQNPRESWTKLVCLWPRLVGNRWRLCRRGTTLGSINHIGNVQVHFWLFILFFPGWPAWKSFNIRFCKVLAIITLSPYYSTLSHNEKMSAICWFLSAIFCFMALINSSSWASRFISCSVTGSSLTVLSIIFLISLSVRRDSLWLGTNLTIRRHDRFVWKGDILT